MSIKNVGEIDRLILNCFQITCSFMLTIRNNILRKLKKGRGGNDLNLWKE